MRNLQKLRSLARVLHQLGFENLGIIPSLCPSGLSWRCVFLAENNGKRREVFASSWMQDEFDINSKEIEESIEEIAAKFIVKKTGFLDQCGGENKVYANWVKNVLQQLEKEELPYAFSDYLSSTSYWKTSKGNRSILFPE